MNIDFLLEINILRHAFTTRLKRLSVTQPAHRLTAFAEFSKGRKLFQQHFCKILEQHFWTTPSLSESQKKEKFWSDICILNLSFLGSTAPRNRAWQHFWTVPHCKTTYKLFIWANSVWSIVANVLWMFQGIARKFFFCWNEEWTYTHFNSLYFLPFHHLQPICILVRNVFYLINWSKTLVGSSGIWTRDLSHPKRESYP